ncbi:glutaredoxin domain-containing cysteine-rich protein 1-like [Anneissia japonica]|uniref:glutaredoxin domain-containing cysteine-rich protein 1-like n=1 Tax=Anneissia japonica TaxID=1529436 RepID=UPI0014257EAD|nr:glutaredoxin domain-containing cysteine-rich protein 1-like [Anneissia japonica]
MPSTKRKGIFHNFLGGRKDRHNDVSDDIQNANLKQKQPPPTSPRPRLRQTQQVKMFGDEGKQASNGPVYDQQTGLYTFPKKTVKSERPLHEIYQAPRQNVLENGDVKSGHFERTFLGHQDDAGRKLQSQKRCENMNNITIDGVKSTSRSSSSSNASFTNDDNRTLRFVGRRGLESGDGDDITSQKGTIRGVQNRVRAGIANFEFKPLDTTKKKYYEEEKGSIIAYTTSTTIVRRTFDNCVKVKKLFENHRVLYEERDLFVNPNHQRELFERIGEEESSNLPIIFIDGELIGNIQQLEELNESGELSNILKRFEKRLNFDVCKCCGDRKYINCVVCKGSKKSVLRNGFTDQFRTLRCTHCDDNGLQKCPKCYSNSS